MKVNLQAVNTVSGSTNRKGDFIPSRDEDDKIIYTNRIRIRVIDPADSYELPSTLSASKVSKISESFDNLRTVEGVEYRLREDSISTFKATDTKPAALLGTYVPASPTVSMSL